jgi:hypothetical protein
MTGQLKNATGCNLKVLLVVCLVYARTSVHTPRSSTPSQEAHMRPGAVAHARGLQEPGSTAAEMSLFTCSSCRCQVAAVMVSILYITRALAAAHSLFLLCRCADGLQATAL